MVSLTRILCSVVVLLPAAVTSQGVYERSLAVVYARDGGTQAQPYSENQFLGYIDDVTNNLTAAVPFFLNLANVTPFQSIISAMKARNIILVPGVGGSPQDGPLNSMAAKNIAAGYRNISDYIRLENLQGFYQDRADGPTEIRDMLDYVINTLKFDHVMLNPWPVIRGGAQAGQLVDYSDFPQADASIYQVRLDFNHATYVVDNSNPDDWTVNSNDVSATQAYDQKHNTSIHILINYENQPQELALNNTQRRYGNSTACMNITIQGCKRQLLHWTPPFSFEYNPVAFGTWNWMANQLSQFQGAGS